MDVPTGCVTLKFVNNAKHINMWDKTVLHYRKLYGGDEKEEWVIEKSGNDYKIRPRIYTEYLYAESKTDDPGRAVKTLKEGTTDANVWKVEQKMALYWISNVKYQECLVISGSDHVVTKKMDSCGDDLWEIQPVSNCLIVGKKN
uniref:16.4 kDa salivary peptide n=1 Tax=Culex quinquefasciatus TaxID=7176 RepID=UPI001BDDCA1F|nr:Chain A, 16.4 kDa salivary peptide [Culex quinquefasciatus]7KC8_B Chain B, 16.4 kDa salivary peptide [Culex quinquefasciatus]7KC8_C Chain C, 16.4 kDa salivary peptide [Culex quinquefasciatus]7KC8_D Chain D, 16.4 kDa salivary peptide [Culex quinquefasciatus]